MTLCIILGVAFLITSHLLVSCTTSTFATLVGGIANAAVLLTLFEILY